MTLEHLFFLSQTVAAFAIVGSLLFVAWEMRNTNRESRHRAAEEIHQKHRSLQLQIASDPDHARVWVAGIHDLASLDRTDRVRFLLSAHVFFKNWESVYLVFVDGQLSREHYDPTEVMNADLLGYAGLRAAWSLRKRYFCEAFKGLVDAKITTVLSRESLLPYEGAKVA